MQTVEYQCWNPPQSPVRVEFPPDLPKELALAGNRELHGSLFGMLLGGDIRVLAGRAESDGMPARAAERDARFSGLNKIGIFVRRPSGEVFLTEPDLERFQGQRSAVALVIAGNRAGFFVRQADGSVQSIRSHEEFVVRGIDVPPAPAAQQTTPQPPAAVKRPGTRQQGATPTVRRSKPRSSAPPTPRKSSSIFPRTAAVLLAIPLAALAYFRPSSAPPVQLEFRQAGDSASISWNPAVTRDHAILEITDGKEIINVPIGLDQSSFSYAPHTTSQYARITAGDPPAPIGAASLAFHPKPPAPESADTAALQSEINDLEAQAADLESSLSSGEARVTSLKKSVAKLTKR